MSDDGGATRDAYLMAIYDEAEGSMSVGVDLRPVNERLGLSKAGEIVMHLESRGYIRDVPMGQGHARLTTEGVERVEQLRRDGLQEQQAVVTLIEIRRIESVLVELDKLDVAEHLTDPDDRAEYEADRATIDAQMKSPRAKRAIMKSALLAVAKFANNVGAGMVAAQLMSIL